MSVIVIMIVLNVYMHRYAECLYAEFLYAECLYTECRLAEDHFAERCYTECQGAVITSTFFAKTPITLTVLTHGQALADRTSFNSRSEVCPALVVQ